MRKAFVAHSACRESVLDYAALIQSGWFDCLSVGIGTASESPAISSIGTAAQRSVPARFWTSIVGVVHGLTLDRSPNLGLVRVLERAIKEAKADLRPSDWE